MSKRIYLGNVGIGAGAPISIQSMTTTDTRDIKSTVDAIRILAIAGADIVRVAVVDKDAAIAIFRIKQEISTPLVADIHFDYQLAISSMESGIDGLRINPGNIGSSWKIKELVKVALERSIPIRIGVNSGSISKQMLKKHAGPTAEAMVESALENVRILEESNFDMIKISVKSSSVPKMVKAYRLLASKVDYPLHLGVTEAGTKVLGSIKSSIGIGSLLLDGIGDTIRVSLTEDPKEEVFVAKMILRSLGLRPSGVELISCPTCARAEADIITLAKDVEEFVKDMQSNIKVAVMGCEVNGPGEAKEADLGVAVSKLSAIIFRKGELVKKVKKEAARDTIFEEIKNFR